MYHNKSAVLLIALLCQRYICVSGSERNLFHVTSLTRSEGFINSPSYPHFYPTHTSREWIISFSENSSLTIILLDLDIEEDPRCILSSCCTHNWVSFSSLQLCGRNKTIPNHMQFSKSPVLVKFHTSIVLRGGRGFKLMYFICRNDQFKCVDNLKCIDANLKCDGVINCHDGSDEHNCKKTPSLKVPECKGDNLVSCGKSDSGCFNNLTQRCDGIVECINTGFDEINCGICGPNKLYCKGGGCYPLNGACDNINHCLGRWDENACGFCPQDHVPCSINDRCHCYHAYKQRCDGQMDCPGGEDEISCVKDCDNEIACASVSGCYSPSGRCNGIKNCADESDEIGCSPAIISKFQCNTARCIEVYLVCNGKDDCGDGSDEVDCHVVQGVRSIIIVGIILVIIIIVAMIALGWRFFVAHQQINMRTNTHGIGRRHEDQEILSDSTHYHLFREPPPSYQEAILQGASPPTYWNSERCLDVSVRPEINPSLLTHCSSRPRPTILFRHPDYPLSKSTVIKPLNVMENSDSHENNVIPNDQLYPENSTSTDSNSNMVESPNSNTNSVTNDESNSTVLNGITHPNLILILERQND